MGEVEGEYSGGGGRAGAVDMVYKRVAGESARAVRTKAH
jgi:hypothetical protein